MAGKRPFPCFLCRDAPANSFDLVWIGSDLNLYSLPVCSKCRREMLQPEGTALEHIVKEQMIRSKAFHNQWIESLPEEELDKLEAEANAIREAHARSKEE